MTTRTKTENAGADACVRHLQCLLRIDTQNPPGNERPAIDYVRATLADAGIDSEVFEPAPGRANLVARLEGDGSERPLLLTSHVDVVAVEPERWTRDPFGGEIADGCIWGRGAVDMKGLTAFELETFLELKRGGKKLKRDVILLVLADEEAGMDHGSKWMVENKPDLIRAEYALNEFGGFTIHLGGKKLYPIQIAEKGNLWLELTAKGDPGHGSVPHARNAVVRLAEVVARLGRGTLARSVHPAAKGFIEVAGEALGGPAKLVLKGLLNPLTARASLAALRKLEPERAAFFAAMLHHTATPTMLSAGQKENVIPSEARAVIDGRFIPGTTADEFKALVQKTVGDGIALREICRGEPSEAPAESPLFQHLCDRIRAHEPEAIPCSWLTVGYTDGANLSRLGIQCYGFFPIRLPEDIDFAKLVHGHDERVPLDGYKWGFEVFKDTVERFVTRRISGPS